MVWVTLVTDAGVDVGRQSGRIRDGLDNFGTRDTQTQGSTWADHPVGSGMVWVTLVTDAGDDVGRSDRIPDGLGNFGTRDTQTQGTTWADHPVGSGMVWVTLVHGILRRRGRRGQTIR